MTNREPDVRVKDLMSSPVVTVGENEKITNAAKLMDKHRIGCVIVADEKGNPVGLITERDVVRRVAAKNLLPSKVTAKKVMSKPLVTVGPDLSLTDAAKKMKQLKIKRLAVVESGKLAGIVTSTDIAEITPTLIDVLAEKSKIAPLATTRETSTLAGYCDRCSAWSDDLRRQDGSFVCPDCLADIEAESEVS